MAIETLLLTTLLPAAVDIVKGLFTRVGERVAGLTVDDRIKLAASDIRRIDALAKLDNPYGTPSQWVIDLRASFRYIAAGVLVLGGLGIATIGVVEKDVATIATGLETAGVPFTFIFGERLWSGLKGPNYK